MRLVDHGGAPPAWRYRVLGPVSGQSCGSLVVLPTEREARSELQRETASRGGHATIDVACHEGGVQPFCWTSLRCEGVAVQWLPGQ